MTFDEQGHVLITPRELEKLAFENPHGLIDHSLLPGTPMGFPTYAKFTQFVDYLSENLGIHPHHFLFRGSTKIGFSISPNREKKKTWRRFGPGSDLDLAITDPHFYATVDEEVRLYDRSPGNLMKVFRERSGYAVKQYLQRIEQKGRHDCYRYFDLPQKLSCVRDMVKALSEAPVGDCCTHNFIEFKAFIFRDRWAVHRRYHTDLDDLRHRLTTKYDPLPRAPEETFPAETLE